MSIHSPRWLCPQSTGHFGLGFHRVVNHFANRAVLLLGFRLETLFGFGQDLGTNPHLFWSLWPSCPFAFTAVFVWIHLEYVRHINKTGDDVSNIIDAYFQVSLFTRVDIRFSMFMESDKAKGCWCVVGSSLLFYFGGRWSHEPPSGVLMSFGFLLAVAACGQIWKK